jgi:hypothetical protein
MRISKDDNGTTPTLLGLASSLSRFVSCLLEGLIRIFNVTGCCRLFRVLWQHLTT